MTGHTDYEAWMLIAELSDNAMALYEDRDGGWPGYSMCLCDLVSGFNPRQSEKMRAQLIELFKPNNRTSHSAWWGVADRSRTLAALFLAEMARTEESK